MAGSYRAHAVRNATAGGIREARTAGRSRGQVLHSFTCSFARPDPVLPCQLSVMVSVRSGCGTPSASKVIEPFPVTVPAAPR